MAHGGSAVSTVTEPRFYPCDKFNTPEALNKYAKNLGVSGSYEFVDVYGLDQDMLGMVPHPVTAVLLLYPISEKSEATKLGTEEDTKDVYFIKQTIGNACGTIGLIHALANNSDSIAMAGDKALAKFLAKTKDSSPDERGKVLEEDSDIGAAHEESAQEGQTQAPPRDEKVNLHFVAFVHKNGGLYEMDGRKSVPTRHGNTTAETLLEDAAKVVQKFMQRDPEQLNFTVVALAKTD